MQIEKMIGQCFLGARILEEREEWRWSKEAQRSAVDAILAGIPAFAKACPTCGGAGLTKEMQWCLTCRGAGEVRDD